MKKYIIIFLLSTILATLTGCPQNEVKEPELEQEQQLEENITQPTTPETDEPAPIEAAETDKAPEGEHVCDVNDPQEIITDETETPIEIEEPVEIEPTVDAKPVIYLYPQAETDISVKIDYNGTFTTTYPEYIDGWNVTAKPDGTLNYNGREYYCLFWEGISNIDYSFEKGFCVKGEDTEKFLEDSLKKLGLTDKEANEFIIYWLPKMENNEYNLISFQEELYTNNAKLTVSPAPDTIIRVFMAWKDVDEFIEIEPQTLTAPERNGFTVIEWGGTEIK